MLGVCSDVPDAASYQKVHLVFFFFELLGFPDLHYCTDAETSKSDFPNS